MTQDLQNNFEVKVLPATAERWKELEALFGPNGAYLGCWCMYCFHFQLGSFCKSRAGI